MACRRDAGVAGRGPLDCRVAALLAMTKREDGNGRGGLPHAAAGLPRRGFAPSRNDNGGETYDARASLAWLGPAPP
jgi:hypothetical protein